MVLNYGMRFHAFWKSYQKSNSKSKFKKKPLHVTLQLPEVINNKIDIVLAVVYNFSSYLTYLQTKI